VWGRKLKLGRQEKQAQTVMYREVKTKLMYISFQYKPPILYLYGHINKAISGHLLLVKTMKKLP
jgi:hypothetical protein